MHLYRTRAGAVLVYQAQAYLLDADWDKLINRKHLRQWLLELLATVQPSPQAQEAIENQLLPPFQSQEIWAAGVTYFRSRTARMEEAEAAGGGSGSFYDRVYEAERPEIFFKATPHRAVGHGGQVRIRRDSSWDVPEPEFTLFVSSEGSIEAYTIGNDMSSRSIEGQNPLYLPQAKTYDACAALGPCLYVPAQPLPPDTAISLEIVRQGRTAFADSATLSQMKRSFEELKGFLFRECSFPQGVFLMTGTCIVPPNEFTLQSGDTVRINVPPIGTLQNTVA